MLKVSEIKQEWNIKRIAMKREEVLFMGLLDNVYKLGLEEKRGGYYIEDTWNCNEYEQIVNVDLVETFNYLIGLKINKYKFLKQNRKKYVMIFGEKNSKNSLLYGDLL